MTLRIFIGADERQPIAFNVAQHSIFAHTTTPVSITKLVIETLPVKRRGLTSFTYTRYLVPWLCNYEGHALFMDADTLARADLSGLPWDHDSAVAVVPHNSVEKRGEQVSVAFERNAVMLFNNAKCRKLTPEYISTGAPNKLAEWADSIASLDKEWNHLVGYDVPNPNAKIAHFTMGIPCFPETKDDEFADEWREAHRAMNGTVSWKEIMGSSVHARWKI